jgi:hypothetical protein
MLFYSDMDIIVVREQHKDRMRHIEQDRLVYEALQSKPQPAQNVSMWVDWLLSKPKPAQPVCSEREICSSVKA